MDRQKRFPLHRKETLKDINGKDVEVAFPIGEFCLDDLEMEKNMLLNDISRNEQRIEIINKQIALIVGELSKKPEEVNDNLIVDETK